MSAPAPGSAPMAVPMAEPRRKLRQYFFHTPQMPAKTLPTFWVSTLPA